MGGKTAQSLETIWKFTKFILKNSRAFRATRRLYDTRINLSLANMELGKITYSDPIYARRVKEFNQVMVELVQGKWLSIRLEGDRPRGHIPPIRILHGRSQ